MAKLLKILSRFLGISTEWFFILLITFAFAIRTSTVQTYFGKVVTNFLTKELKAEFKIEQIDVVFFDRIYLKNVFVRDLHDDTLASLNQIMVRFDRIDLTGNRIGIKSVGLYSGRVGVERDTITGNYNYEFIADYFSGEKSSKKRTTPPIVTIKNLSIEDVTISYDDYRKSYNTYGMDYDHLRLNHVFLDITDFREEDNIITFNIDRLTAYEKSDFWLNELHAKCKVDPEKGLFFSKLKVRTARSKIYCSKLNLLMSDFEGLQEAEDSITFDATLDSSSINLRDISIFAPALEGMNDQVWLKGKVSRKVKNLKITDLDLRFGRRSVLLGTYSLPDFRNLKASNFNEFVDYVYLDFNDLERLTLPKDAGGGHFDLDTYIERLGHIELKQTRWYGSVDQFWVKGNRLGTDLGNVRLPNDLCFTADQNSGYAFYHTENEDYDIYIDTFNLGKFLNDDEFGYVRGKVWADGFIGKEDLVRFTKMNGEIESFDFHGYKYHHISVYEGSLIDNELKASVDVKDPNLVLSFDGEISAKKIQNYDFHMNVESANLGVLNFSNDPKSSASGNMLIQMRGTRLDDYEGHITANEIHLFQNDKKVYVQSLSMGIQRGEDRDNFNIESTIAQVNLSGKIHFSTFFVAVNNGLAEAFPSLFTKEKYPGGKKLIDNFVLDVTTKHTEDILAVFLPELEIDNNTVAHLEFNSGDNYEYLTLKSSRIAYQDLFFSNKKAFMQDIDLRQVQHNGQADLELDAGRTSISDSLFVHDFHVDLAGTQNLFNTQIDWNKGIRDSTKLMFKLNVVSKEEYKLDLVKDSYFSLKDNLWEVFNTSSLTVQPNRYAFDHLVLERESQFLAVNGVASDDPNDELHIRANDLHLNEFTSLLGVNYDLEGLLNADIDMTTPFTTLRAQGEMNVSELKVEQKEVGDVHVQGDWIDEEEKFNLFGDLRYLKNETFDFQGFYYPFRDKNSLDFKLLFKDMDISFANAFVDEEVLSDMHGTVLGNVDVTGELDNVQIDGQTQLRNAGLKVGILGTRYNISGPIQFDGENDGIYGVLPVTDEEGNSAYAIATCFHNNFEDFSLNFDLNFDESVRYFSNPLSGQILPYTGRFLAMNTGYTEDAVYYGKAYARGTASILIAKGQTVINVSAETEKGTLIKLPLYGASEVNEFDFISFNQDTLTIDPKVDLTGVDMTLEIMATPDANFELILDPKTEEIIRGNGSGKLNLRADNYGQVLMDGVYSIKSGTYDFVLWGIRKPFIIKPGSTISWSGDPLEANLNIATYYSVSASLAELNPGLASSDNLSKKEVQCMLYITQTLSNPNIRLDIQVPNISEAERPELDRIRSDQDELNKQFFTLLVARRFQGTNTKSTNSNGLADVLTQQVNYLLDQMSKDLKMNVAYDKNSVTGDQKFAFGFKRAFGDKKNIILKTSLGVNNNNTTGTNTSTLIGDFSLDYVITPDGTVRVTIFNESNDKGALTNKDKGDYTQGVGLHYEENFNKVSDSRIIEFFTNAFRKKNKKKVKNAKRKKRESTKKVLINPATTPKRNDEEGNP